MTAPLVPAEQTFFQDPAFDRMMGVVMALAAEVFVLRQEVHRLSAGADAAPEDADAFVRHLLEPVLGERPHGSGA